MSFIDDNEIDMRESLACERINRTDLNRLSPVRQRVISLNDTDLVTDAFVPKHFYGLVD